MSERERYRRWYEKLKRDPKRYAAFLDKQRARQKSPVVLEKKRDSTRERYHTDPEFREQAKARARAYAKQNYARLEQKRKERLARRSEEEVERTKELNRQAQARRRSVERANRRARELPVVETAPTPPRMPYGLRTLWTKAQPGSVIRRKYPSPRALQLGWERGELAYEEGSPV